MSLKNNVLSSLNKIALKDYLKRKDPLFKGRREYKFLVPLDLIPHILEYLKEDFKCLEHEEGGIFLYNSVYYDSENMSFFNMHRQKKLNRLKIRIREYKSGKKGKFIERKTKTKGTYTSKKRSKIDSQFEDFMSKQFITDGINHHGLKRDDLSEKVHIDYKRIFMVSRDFKCRVTIDFDIEANDLNGKKAQLIPNFAVLEVKQEGLPKEIMRFLRRNFKIRRKGFSKYCVATCMLFDNVKKNKWKQTLKYNEL